jgi:hypothetical protein
LRQLYVNAHPGAIIQKEYDASEARSHANLLCYCGLPVFILIWKYKMKRQIGALVSLYPAVALAEVVH